MNDYKNRYSEEPEISMIADFEGDEANLFNQKVDEELPILPLRDVVIFPGVILPVQIGRTASLKVVKYCYQNNCQLVHSLSVMQKWKIHNLRICTKLVL